MEGWEAVAPPPPPPPSSSSSLLPPSSSFIINFYFFLFPFFYLLQVFMFCSLFFPHSARLILFSSPELGVTDLAY